MALFVGQWKAFFAVNNHSKGRVYARGGGGFERWSLGLEPARRRFSFRLEWEKGPMQRQRPGYPSQLCPSHAITRSSSFTIASVKH